MNVKQVISTKFTSQSSKHKHDYLRTTPNTLLCKQIKQDKNNEWG